MSSSLPTESTSSSSSVNGSTHEKGTAAQNASDESQNMELSEEEIRARLSESARLKEEGTEAFRAKQWAQARVSYSMALARLPPRVKESQDVPFDRTEIPKPGDEVVEHRDDEPDESGDAEAQGNTKLDKGKERETKPSLSGIQLEVAKARAVLNANIGACYVNQEKYAEAVKACSEAIEDDPAYIKAIQRRAASNEKIGTWSALSSTEEDYNTLLKLLPSDSPQVNATKRALQSLKPRLEEAQKKETAEMFGKLKGLGNSILGNFGLSTDNFKFEPNGQGGYSFNFVR